MSSVPVDFGSEESVALRMRLKVIREEIVQAFESLSPEARAVTERLNPIREQLDAAIRKEMRRTAAELYVGWEESKNLPLWIQVAGYYVDLPDFSALTMPRVFVIEPPKNPSFKERLLARWRKTG